MKAPRPKSITVVGSCAMDVVDGGPQSAGGCPAFAAEALVRAGGAGRVIGRIANGDRAVFAQVLEDSAVPVTLLPAATTTGFTLTYDGDRRAMTVDPVGDPWTLEELDAAAIETPWVHLAPLLRSDFPTEAIVRLPAAGHQVSFDGQGLVRIPRVGELGFDDAYDPELLGAITVLKLSEGEARIVGGGAFGLQESARLGIPEILVTFGSGGCDLYADGGVTRVPARRIRGVQATGAGDTFMVSYVSARAQGTAPLGAAQIATAVVAQLLEDRLVESATNR